MTPSLDAVQLIALGLVFIQWAMDTRHSFRSMIAILLGCVMLYLGTSRIFLVGT